MDENELEQFREIEELIERLRDSIDHMYPERPHDEIHNEEDNQDER